MCSRALHPELLEPRSLYILMYIAPSLPSSATSVSARFQPASRQLTPPISLLVEGGVHGGAGERAEARANRVDPPVLEGERAPTRERAAKGQTSRQAQ